MNAIRRYVVLVVGLAAALPQSVLAASLSYSEAYVETLRNGEKTGTELLVLKGQIEFGERMSPADLSADTAWSVVLQGERLVSGVLGDGARQSYGAQGGKSVVRLSSGGVLKFTWNADRIDFTLKWKGRPALAGRYRDQTTVISASGYPVDIAIGGLKGYFDVSATGQARIRIRKGVALSSIALKGSATSAGLEAPDRDGDGYGADVDCKDFDAAIHPDATETTLDGVDSNCDGRDSGVPEVIDTFSVGGNFTSPAVSFARPDAPGSARDFSGWDKTFLFPSVGKRSFYDPSVGNYYNDDTMTPVTDGQIIWRGWPHTGKWGFFNGSAGDRITLTLAPDASVEAPGTHPAFILFWRPEGGPLTWEGTQDIDAGQTVPENSDIIPAHNMPQRADWTIRGLPAKTDHTAPSGVDSALYPRNTDSYTLYHVDAGYDADKYVAGNVLLMHTTALNPIAVSDGGAGKLSKTLVLPKDGYYLLYVGNVLESAGWSLSDGGKLQTVGEIAPPAIHINVTISKP
ncbi:MAG: MopE-related protein [Methylomonas sp.]|nr:MopE-related protein [Methylomonas sp.]